MEDLIRVKDSQVLTQLGSECHEQISQNDAIKRFSQTVPIYRPRFWDYFRQSLTILILLAVDYNAVLLGIYSAFWGRLLVVPLPFLWKIFVRLDYKFFYFLIPLFFIGLICYEKLYQRRLPFWKCAGKLVKISTFATLFIVGILYFTGTAHSLSRIFVGLVWLFVNFYLITGHYLTKRILVACGLWRQPVLVIGTKETIALLSNSFEHNPDLGYQITGIIVNTDDQTVRYPYPVLGTIENLEEAISSSGVAEVVIALPQLQLPELAKLIHQVKPLVKNVAIMPDLQGLPLNNPEIDFSFYQKTVILRVRNNLLDWHNLVFKRIFDLILGLTALLVAWPVMLFIAVLIKLDSSGPVIHAAGRLGKEGRKFKCYKFRTMFIDGHKLLKQYLAHNRVAAEEWCKRQYKMYQKR